MSDIRISVFLEKGEKAVRAGKQGEDFNAFFENASLLMRDTEKEAFRAPFEKLYAVGKYSGGSVSEENMQAIMNTLMAPLFTKQ